MDAKVKPQDKFVTVAGLRTRYLEEGQGPAVILLHGASLGSAADVFAAQSRAAGRLRPARHRL